MDRARTDKAIETRPSRQGHQDKAIRERSQGGHRAMTPAPPLPQAIVLITGIQAAGKSTVAQRLAERLPRSAHVRGDLFRRMVINGRADMTPDPCAEAVRQLRLRHRLTAATCDAYFREGFTVVAQDIVLGEHLAEMVDLVQQRPLLIVVLAPRPDVVAAREAARGKSAYSRWTIDLLDRGLRAETPRLGLWLDTSDQTVTQTVDEIMRRAWTEAAV
jgi:cytidylate kinase